MDPEQKFECANAFPLDTYDTPADNRRSFWDHLCCGTRLFFYVRNFFIFARAGWQAKHTPFPASAQTSNALGNFRLIEQCGGTAHLRGLDHLSECGPAVIIGNHMSLLETAVLHAFLRPRRPFCFVIKESLLKVPFFGNIMRKLGCIAVGRSNPREDLRLVMEEGKKQLAAGISVVIFPQSHRTDVFDEAHFNTIGVKLARYANVPVIPLALRTDFLANGKLVKDLGPVRRDRPVWFEFGAPLKVTGNGHEAQAQIIAFIKSHLKEWGCEVREQNNDVIER